MRTLLLVLLLLLSCASQAQEQEAEWWNYETLHAGHPVVIRVDMGLRRQFPISGFPYVIVTRLSYASDRGDGLPAQSDQDRLEAVADAVAAAIARKTRSIHAGSASSQGHQESYVYVIDPNGLEALAASVASTLCKECQVRVKVRADAAWALYRDELLPDAQTRQRYGLRAY